MALVAHPSVFHTASLNDWNIFSGMFQRVPKYMPWILVSQGENMNQRVKISALVLAALTLASMTATWAQAQPEDFQLPRPSFSPGHPLYGVELFIEENIEVP